MSLHQESDKSDQPETNGKDCQHAEVEFEVILKSDNKNIFKIIFEIHSVFAVTGLSYLKTLKWLKIKFGATVTNRNSTEIVPTNMAV